MGDGLVVDLDDPVVEGGGIDRLAGLEARRQKDRVGADLDEAERLPGDDHALGGPAGCVGCADRVAGDDRPWRGVDQRVADLDVRRGCQGGVLPVGPGDNAAQLARLGRRVLVGHRFDRFDSGGDQAGEVRLHTLDAFDLGGGEGEFQGQLPRIEVGGEINEVFEPVK